VTTPSPPLPSGPKLPGLQPPLPSGSKLPGLQPLLPSGSKLPGLPPSLPSGWKLPSLRITRDGDWLHEGGDVTHPGILANLRENLRHDESGYHLQVGPVRIPVEVDDAPYVVVRLAVEGDDAEITLNDMTREPLAVDTLAIDAEGVPHCRVKDGRFPARFSRAAAYQLLDRVEHDQDGQRAALVVGSRRHPLAMAARVRPS
jgi:hypothetical protein